MSTPETPLTLMIVEDEAAVRRTLQAHFSEQYQVVLAAHGREALDIAQQQPVHILVTDLILPSMDGLELMRQLRELYPDLVTIVITGHGTIRSAVQAMKDGALDYIPKPFDLEELEALLQKAAEQYRLKEENRRLHQQMRATLNRAGLVGNSTPMQEVFHLIERVANSRATVLVRGESGTGKELVAKAIHYSGNRAKKPFVAVSCAALPETLLESELFGHEKNAFTGAASQKLGRFELANGGTLFLDEIAEVPPSIQVKLLRVIQERQFERLGGTKTIKVDVRLIAATNKDLEKAVEQGAFREDLYFRLQVIQIYLPPLRERKNDIPLLVEHFLQRFNAENDKLIQAATPEAMELLMKYHWPGNVRELENAIERAVVLAEPDEEWLTPEMLPAAVQSAAKIS